MPVTPPFNIYREQLWPLCHGFALWKPNPVEGIYNQVSIGDVGYIYEGGFIRMFNVTLPCDDESNKTLGEPCRYDPLSSDSFAIRRETFGKVDYYSRRVSREEIVNTQAASPDEAKYVTYRCRGRGAILSLPNGGLRQDVIHTKLFQKYIGDNVATWFDWSKDKGLPVERMEDLVFVYGCTLVTPWAAAAFDDHTGNAQLSLASRTLNNGGAGFTWSNIRGTVEYQDSQLQPNIPNLPQNRCVFMKCLRAKRVFFWKSMLRACFPHDEASNDAVFNDEEFYEAPSHDEAPYDTPFHDEAPYEAPYDAPFHDEAPYDVPFHDEAPYDALSHDEASHDAHDALFHTVSFPDDPNSPRGSVIQLTGDPDDPEYLDPLVGVLNYVAEVRLPVHDLLLYLHLATTKRTFPRTTTPYLIVSWPLPTIVTFSSLKGWIPSLGTRMR
ncbi:hypothetical protein V8E52_002269 [Russula decolorans]